jgi:O-antigen ligase
VPLCAQEIALVAVTSVHVAALPWLLGGTRLWAQLVSFGLALVGLAIAFWPREDSDRGAADERTGTSGGTGGRKLRSFPIFWLGIAGALFVGVQMLNPAWRYTQSAGAYWLIAVPHLDWLPHGIAQAPFATANAGRVMLMLASPWLVACSLWIGITRRRSAIALLTALALNGVVIAAIALLQRLTHATELLWHWPAPAHYFVGTFVYKNHAGAFFNLIIALCLGLAWWRSEQARRRLEKSHPGILYLFLVIVPLLALLFSYARAATALGLAYLVIVGVGFLVHTIFFTRGGLPATVTLLLGLLGAVFLVVCVRSLNTETVWERFDRLFKQDEVVSIVRRQVAAQATVEMARDSVWFGHGAGSFRYLFPKYQGRHPEIARDQASSLYWEHAHNDYAELFAESGLFGVGLFVIALSWAVLALHRAGVFAQPPRLALLGGPLLVLLNAVCDFPGACPAIVTTSVVVIVATIRAAQVERGLA